MKKVLLLALTMVTSTVSLTPAFAMGNITQEIVNSEKAESVDFTESNGFKLYIDGQKKSLENSFAVSNNRTFLPMREVSKLLGLADENIAWDSENGVATIKSDNILIEIPVGRTKANVNDTIVAIDNSGETRSFKKETEQGGVTYLPLRFLAENLGYNVKYYGDTNTIHIYKGETEPAISEDVPLVTDENEFVRKKLGTPEETGSLPFDFDGDGRINGCTSIDYSYCNATLQRVEVIKDFEKVLKSKITAPETVGALNEVSEDGNFVYTENGWKWSPTEDSYFSKTVEEMSKAIDRTSQAYLNK